MEEMAWSQMLLLLNLILILVLNQLNFIHIQAPEEHFKSIREFLSPSSD